MDDGGAREQCVEHSARHHAVAVGGDVNALLVESDIDAASVARLREGHALSVSDDPVPDARDHGDPVAVRSSRPFGEKMNAAAFVKRAPTFSRS